MLERGTIVPLRVELKPFERIVIGETVLVNSGTRTSFLIDGDAPILRERDTITAETANTPAKRLYLCLQTMYLKNDIPRYRTAYQGFLRELRDSGNAYYSIRRCAINRTGQAEDPEGCC